LTIDGIRPENLGFAPDSPLEEAVCCEPVSEVRSGVLGKFKLWFRSVYGSFRDCKNAYFGWNAPENAFSVALAVRAASGFKHLLRWTFFGDRRRGRRQFTVYKKRGMTTPAPRSG